MLVLHYGSCTFIGRGLSDRLTKVWRNDFWIPWSAFISSLSFWVQALLYPCTLSAQTDGSSVTARSRPPLSQTGRPDSCSSVTASVPSPYLSWLSYQAKAAPVLTLWARLSSLVLSAELAVNVCCSLLMWGNRSAHSLTLWARVKCPNASLTNVISPNDRTVALWTCS